jgi:hypothetical protein
MVVKQEVSRKFFETESSNSNSGDSTNCHMSIEIRNPEPTFNNDSSNE